MNLKLLTLLAAGAFTGNVYAGAMENASDALNVQIITDAINRNTNAIRNSSSYGSWSWPRSKKTQQRINAAREAAWNKQLEQWKAESEFRELIRRNQEEYYLEQSRKETKAREEALARANFNASVADGTVEIRKALPAK